jgi:hypothetical protein
MAESDFDARDYLESDEYADGVFDAEAQIQLIEPPDRAVERGEFLSIGRPGVDGIEWGYRKGKSGFWAYYPLEDEYRELAPTLKDFLDGWRRGEITV